MCAKFGCGPTVVSKKGVYRQRTLQLYIVDGNIVTSASEQNFYSGDMALYK